MNFNEIRTVNHRAGFCVVGGGLAGICAAVAAARKGIKVVLMHERPVLGGNASSEIRMWVCGAKGKNNRETGIIEEICMENLYRNPTKNYNIWDTILYETVIKEENIELLLNCSCCSAKAENGEIRSVTGWQMTTQQWHTVEADLFADCSGDSILAPLCGAEFRFGREDPAEFGEACSYDAADLCTMGMSCLIQGRLTDRKIKFTAPSWATKMTPEMIAARPPHINSERENFWYLELGGDEDSIGDTEEIAKKLIALALGMWDYIKNSGTTENADYWELEFLGFLPGKRESRRMVGPVIMNQNDILSGGKYEDNVAFGGWPLDDHHPGGFYHPGCPNTDIHTPSPYGIPYRCLYSVNIRNLFFAGRNISMTHAAMSSTRVMATCAILGQAVGTAAAIALKNGLSPDGVYRHKTDELQQELMTDGCFIPCLRRRISQKSLNAHISSDRETSGIENLRNGADRNNRTYGDSEQGCFTELRGTIRYTFERPERINRIHIAFDSDLERETLEGSAFVKYHSMQANIFPDAPLNSMPKTMPKRFTVSAVDGNGRQTVLLAADNNRLPVINIETDGSYTEISLKVDELWCGGTEKVHIFSFDVG